MKLLLAFMLVTFLLAIRAAHHGRASRQWPLILASLVVGAAYYSLRVI